MVFVMELHLPEAVVMSCVSLGVLRAGLTDLPIPIRVPATVLCRVLGITDVILLARLRISLVTPWVTVMIPLLLSLELVVRVV